MKPLILELPPSVNFAYTNNECTGRRIYTDASKNWYQWVWPVILRWKRENNLKKPFDYFIKTHCNFYLRRLNSDSHNYFKLLADALEKYEVVTDDRFIMFVTEKVSYDRENPRIEITFKNAEETPPRLE